MERLSTIRSARNPLLKRVRAVLAGKDKTAIVLEGDRLVEDARAAGVALGDVLLADDDAERIERWTDAGVKLHAVDAELLARVGSLVTGGGCVALAPRPRSRSLDELELGSEGLVAVLAGVADPGNLGAIARSAEAAGATALVVLEGGASPWNTKALRGSMGSLLRLAVFEERDADRVVSTLTSAGARHVAAGTRGGADHDAFDWRGPIALWLASETGALPQVAAGFERVSIPMRGAVESLNVAVAASLLLFAARRGRSA